MCASVAIGFSRVTDYVLLLQIIGSLLLAGTALTAVVPVLPKTLQPPSVERPGNRQLDGAVHQTLTVGSQGSGAVAARVVEITDDVTDEWTNQVARKRKRRETGQVSNVETD